jgi:histidinol-phosphate phosphatase family protein
MRQALILAGGAGTRLKSIAGNLPKPLVDVGGTPLLGRQLTMLAEQGFEEVIVLAGNRNTPDDAGRFDQIAAYCGDGSLWDMRLSCVEEVKPRGTAGAVLMVAERLETQFVVLYGDTVLDVDLRRMIVAHDASSSGATLFLHPNDHPQDSDLVEVDQEDRVVAFHAYPHPPGAELRNLVNAALYVIDRDKLLKVDGLPELSDFGRHAFPRMLAQGLPILGYRSPEYIKDAGTPVRIEKVRRDVAIGRLQDRSFAKASPAVFVDRDGVLNQERGLISNPSNLDLVEGSASAVRKLNESRFRAICLTNQPVVARGDVTWPELDRIHSRLDFLLGLEGAFLDDLYVCPHHPDKGFSGERPEYKFDCNCRKPATGLIEAALQSHNLDLSASWMVGDRTTDIEFARRAGLRSVLVETGYGGKDGQFDVQPDYVAADLASAVDLILQMCPQASYTY